jgi:peptidoglycan/xylan/chitin deacetylase (PgdA/CDA1 family)
MDRSRAVNISGVVVRPLDIVCAGVLAVTVAVVPLHSVWSAPKRPRAVFAPVLIYHHVKWLKPSDDAIERGLTVLPGEFDWQVNYLASHHYGVITARQLANHLVSGAALPPHPVVLTFDDGYSDVYPDVYRVLLRLHLKATFFIVPGFLNTPRYLTWREVETMAAHGMDIEAHSMSHPDLTTLSPRSVRWQLTQSRAELQSHIHVPVHVFAYPYGAHSPAVIGAVSRAGYTLAFTTEEGWVESSSRLLTEPRVYIDLDDSHAIFIGRLSANPQVLAEDPT